MEIKQLFRSRQILISLIALLVLFLIPGKVSAHTGGGASPIAPALAWFFLGFGVLVILIIAFVLFFRKTNQPAPEIDEVDKMSGLQGYLGRIQLFSRNARLYMIHVVGMDVIYGTWAVLFNLYLLAVGFDVAFVGLRILVGAIAGGLASIPAGLISDRIGRKLSFVLGDGMGALMSLVAISSANESILLVTAAVGGLFGALHGVAEPAFMAENSQDHERVHLFSVSGGTRTAAMIIGSALAGLVPLLVAASDEAARVEVYRAVAYVGIVGWFASLIPAIMLKQIVEPARSEKQQKRGIFANVKNPGLIFRLTLPEVLVALGAGFALPLMNVFFQGGVGSEEVEIGAVFSAGQAFLVVASFLAPIIAARMGKVRSVVVTRALSIPFILLIAFSPSLGNESISVLSIAGLAYIGRITFMNMASPVRSAYAMELLHQDERGTQVGIENAFAAGLSGIASYYGAQLMDIGNFQLPFIFMAIFYVIAVAAFWIYFGRQQEQLAAQPA